MKTIIYILVFVLPILGSAQQPWYKSSSLDYMWVNVGNAGFSAGSVRYASLAFDPIWTGYPYVAYSDNANSNKVSVMRYNDTSWVNAGNTGFSAGEGDYTSLTFGTGNQSPYVAFQDWGGTSSEQGKATVMMLYGSSWVNVGNSHFSAGMANYTSIAFNPLNNQPYVAYVDWGNSKKTTVMMFYASNWVNVGNAGFSAGEAAYTCIAFSPSDYYLGIPFIAFEDYGNSQKATVMKFNGTNWVNVGNAGFSAGYALYTSLAISPYGEPYVAYQDGANSGKSTVMKYNGTSWVNVGNAGFSAGKAKYTSIAFSPTMDSQPYVAYTDSVNSYKVTVKRYDGNNWVNVGSAGFSADTSEYISLAFNPAGYRQPYVAFKDNGNSNKATVMRYDSVSVGIRGPQESKLFVFPNPVKSTVTFDFKGVNVNNKSIYIYELRGKKILKTQTNQDRIILNLEKFPTGIYIYKVNTESSYWIGKFCKD